LAGQPFLEGLVEPFDFAAGGGVVRAGVLLEHAVASEFGLEAVDPAAAASETRRVHQAVVGQR
jgi:hypothetical protein